MSLASRIARGQASEFVGLTPTSRLLNHARRNIAALRKEKAMQANAAEKIEQNPLDAAAERLEQAKETLAKAKAFVVEAEQRIIDIVGVAEEGSTSINTDNYRVTTTGKLNRSIDVKKIPALEASIPAAILSRLIVMKPSIKLAELRFIENNEPDTYRVICDTAMTTKPAKPSVSISPLEG